MSTCQSGSEPEDKTTGADLGKRAVRLSRPDQGSSIDAGSREKGGTNSIERTESHENLKTAPGVIHNSALIG